MPGITRVGLDPISRGPLQLRRRGHHTLDPRIDQVTSQPKAGRARLIDHHCRPRQRPDPVTNFSAARCQPPLKNLTGFSVQSTPDHRSCVHIQPDARTMTFHWGLLHLWLYRPGPDSCRQPTFTCTEAPASSYRLTGRNLQSPRGSQTHRSRAVARPNHHTALHTISAVAPRFVHKSVTCC